MSKKILVVDDEPFIVQMVTSRLKSSGYELLSAADGDEALKKARSEQPDLIILDLMLPKIDGFQVCATLKQDERYKHIPIVLLTAKGGEESRQIGIEECGADDYVTKPFDAQALLEKIKKLLK